MARELGMTHAELLNRMSASEFAYWLALVGIEHQEREKAQRDAEDKARARQMSRSLSSLR